jgi:ribosomal protein S18 acetylase RimI-like enzyme
MKRILDMYIREIEINDYDEMYCLWTRIPGIGLSSADSRSNIQKFLLRNKGLSFLCLEEEKIVGTVLCGHDGRRGYIYHVAVDEGYRGKGIGRALVEKSLNQLKKEGIDKCHLFVFVDNFIGNSFWTSLGWTKREDILVYSKANLINRL